MNTHRCVARWLGCCLVLAGALLVSVNAVGAEAAAEAAAEATTEDEGFESDTFEPFFFLHFGDPQIAGDAEKARFAEAVRQANELKPAFVIIAGDLVSGRKPEEWAAFDEVLALCEVPVYLVPGNHDMDTPALREEYVKKYGPDFYAFTYNNCTFINLDSELIRPAFAETELPAEQWKFLEDTLKDCKEKERDHVFFSTHCPPYYKRGEADGGNEAFKWPLEDRKRLLGLAREYGVRNILCGHLHNTKEVVPEDNAFTIYVTTGTAFEFSDTPVFGYRIFKVKKDGIEQAYVDLNQPVEEKKTFIAGE